jgi:hypothetical protein
MQLDGVVFPLSLASGSVFTLTLFFHFFITEGLAGRVLHSALEALSGSKTMAKCAGENPEGEISNRNFRIAPRPP